MAQKLPAIEKTELKRGGDLYGLDHAGRGRDEPDRYPERDAGRDLGKQPVDDLPD